MWLGLVTADGGLVTWVDMVCLEELFGASYIQCWVFRTIISKPSEISWVYVHVLFILCKRYMYVYISRFLSVFDSWEICFYNRSVACPQWNGTRFHAVLTRFGWEEFLKQYCNLNPFLRNIVKHLKSSNVATFENRHCKYTYLHIDLFYSRDEEFLYPLSFCSTNGSSKHG